MYKTFKTVAACSLAFLAMMVLPVRVYAMDYEDYPVAKLRSLDKITARTTTFEVKVGSTVRFGEIFIKVQSCRKPPPVEKTEAASFLQIWQTNAANDTSKWIFSGWMFASSPALSSMDHPVYDVWVLDCLGRDPEPLPKTSDTGVQPPPTDGAAPDAVPPAVEPDTAAKMKEDISKEDDPGAFDEETAPADSTTPSVTPEESVPASNMPPSAQPVPSETNQGDAVQDEMPADDSSPMKEEVPVVPDENPTLPAEQPKQEIQGIY